jgi:hypothetical protein
MSDAGKAVRKYHASLSKKREHEERDRAKWLEDARRFRFAWAEGHETLYKFKSLSGDSRDHVLGMIEKSSIYFSIPDEFNDPLDCAPVLKLAKDPSDPEFIEELQADEARVLAESGRSTEEIAEMRRSKGVDVRQVGSAATNHTRKQLRDDSRIFCLSAKQDHPLLWSHYADSHKGVCLHFRCRGGTVFGAARAVEYQQERRPILIPMKYNKSEDDIAAAMSRTKAEFWSYEEEYRIIGYERAEWGYKLHGRFCFFEPSLLCGITLGMNVSVPNRTTVMTWAAKRIPTIPVYQAGEDEDRFWMNVWRVR